MLKFKISLISDSLFIIFSSFLICFTISFYFLKSNVNAIFVSVPFSIVVFCFYMIIYKKKKGKLAVKREDEESFLKCVNALCLASREKALTTVFKTLEKLDKNPILTSQGIVCGNDFYFVRFSYDPITTDGIIKAYKKTPKSKNLIYVAINFSNEASTFADGFFNKIRLVPLSQFFPFMKTAGTIPNGGFIPTIKKIGLVNLLKGTFNKSKSKTIALYGSFLLIMSRFVFFPIWYIISGSLFLLYAITAKFFAPKPIEKTFI